MLNLNNANGLLNSVRGVYFSWRIFGIISIDKTLISKGHALDNNCVK